MKTTSVMNWTSATLAAALLGCAPRVDATGAAPDAAKVPMSAVTSATTKANFFVDNAVTEVRYVRAAMHIADPKPEKVLTLASNKARRDALLEKADVGSWKREYADDRVSDGMRWVVEFVSDGKVVKRVDGFNAEPDGLKYLLEACGVRTGRAARRIED